MKDYLFYKTKIIFIFGFISILHLYCDNCKCCSANITQTNIPFICKKLNINEKQILLDIADDDLLLSLAKDKNFKTDLDNLETEINKKEHVSLTKVILYKNRKACHMWVIKDEYNIDLSSIKCLDDIPTDNRSYLIVEHINNKQALRFIKNNLRTLYNINNCKCYEIL